MQEMDAAQEIRRIILRLSEQSPSGFAIAFHIRYTTPDFLFQTYSKSWIDSYSQQGLVMHDPIVAWGFANTGTVRWTDLAKDDPMGVLEQSAPYGLRFGFAWAVYQDGSRSLAGFARPDREFTDSEIASISQDVAILHAKTAQSEALSPELREELKQMSIAFTHP